jgi:hypothetical protein
LSCLIDSSLVGLPTFFGISSSKPQDIHLKIDFLSNLSLSFVIVPLHLGQINLIKVNPLYLTISSFILVLSKRIKPCLSGKDQHLSLCYVEDIIQAILLAAQSQEPSGEIFFLSDGQDYRLEEIGDVFAQAMGVNAYCVRIPEWTIAGGGATIVSDTINHTEGLQGLRPTSKNGITASITKNVSLNLSTSKDSTVS